METDVAVLREQLQQRAQRLYILGEFSLAARILLELAPEPSVTAAP
jgi:hypothetical protein